MSARRLATRLAAVLAASLVLALSACATIPRSGAVVRGGSVAAQDNGFDQIDYHPNPPSDGESQQDILNGFIDAAVSPAGGYQVARAFLSDSFRGEWDPDASVTVDDAAQRTAPVPSGASELSMSVTPVAFIDGAGDYRTAGSQAPVTLGYSFVKQHGQWRISKAPNGIVIDAALFRNVFSSHALYFYSPDFRYLVPDLRWFPSSSASLATRIVKALLAGPSPWLQDAVATAFPKGTQLAAGSVVVQTGTAQVALNSVAAGADQTTTVRMNQQLGESLTDAASQVSLSIGGVQQDVSTVTQAERDPSVSANPLVLQNGKFGFLASSAFVAFNGIGPAIAALHASAATVTADGRTAAVLAGDAVYAVTASQSAPVRIDARPDLLPPAVDNSDIVWSATTDPRTPFDVAAADGATAQIKASWPDARSLVSFSVSRDGTRLAALVRTEDGRAHLMVAGIVRDARGHPTRIGAPVDIGELALSKGYALTWTDELTVAVLGASPQGGTAIISQALGDAAAAPQPGPDGGVGITGGNPAAQLWVRTAQGALETTAGTSWQQVAKGVDILAVQQGRN
ncbi:MAG: LpqB family beta-propeller domain-containing protein [Microbacteriaceae bacterium]|nr:LpqB family beta-propeller domain-containing protein [Microbacteriaceae bacterium]MCL2794594.1 LpqB family beta-propeller domain-containing protein [Microbacteriaceae bacterium]